MDRGKDPCRFGNYDSIRATLEKDSVSTRDEALLDIYRKLRPGEPPTVEAAQALLDNMYFTPRRYDLAKVGRYKVNRKLGVDVPLDSPEASVLSQDDIAQMITTCAPCMLRRVAFPVSVTARKFR